MLVDSHCHLDFPDLAGRLPEIFAAMDTNAVAVAVCIGVNLEDLPRVLALAESHSRLYATVGVHPEHSEGEEPSLERLLAAYEPGQTVQVHAFRRDELHCFTLQLARPALDECVLSRQS